MKTRLFTLLLAALTALTARSEQRFNSLPGASATIYLDFDGETVLTALWNNGHQLQCAAATLSADQISEIFHRVAEDYRPFNVNITTDEAVFNAAPYDQRMRVIVTPTSSWFANVGGIAFVGSFTWGDDTPCFVFSDRLNNNSKMIAECCAHESGHTLGLSHQSKYDGSCNLTATYNDGNGTGEAAWAPIMGNSYGRNMSGWNNGPTPYGCTNVQDNLSIITSMNGFGYRADDYSDSINSRATLLNASNIDVAGIISTNTDKDVFRIQQLYPSNFHLVAHPFSVSSNNEGADLDIRMYLYDAAGHLLNTYNPANTMSVTVDTILDAGEYYIVIDGTGNNNASDYGSLGSYTLKGISGVLPVCSVSLNGIANRNRHALNWSLVCYETLKQIDIEGSQDGVHFYSIGTAALQQNNYEQTATSAGNQYYRLKIVSTSERVVYSNTVLLRSPEAAENSISISTLVQQQIAIRTVQAFDYCLLDMNGKCIMKGSGNAGFNKIDIQGKASGIYLLQLSLAGKTSAYRIVKQ